MSNATERGCRTSAIQLAQKCPFACQKIYRDKLEGFKNLPALLGSMLHNLLEEYATYCIANKRDTDYFFFDSIVEKHIASLPEILHHDGRAIARHLKDSANFANDLEAQEVHIEDRIMLNDKLEYTENIEEKYHSGAIDRYYIEYGGKTAYVFDYKSYRKISSKVELEANLQRIHYPYLVFARHPEVEEIYFYFDFIRYGYITQPFHYTRDEDFETLKEQVKCGCEQYYSLVNTLDDMEARPSGFCCICEIMGVCPAVKNALLKSAIVRNDDDAINAARELKAGEKKLKQLKDSLKEWVEIYGPIKITEKEEYGHSLIESHEIDDVHGLIEYLKDNGAKVGAIYDILSVSKSKFAKLIQAYKINKEECLKKFGHIKRSTRIVYRDIEVEDEGEDEARDSE